MRAIIYFLLCFGFVQSGARADENAAQQTTITPPAKLEQRGDWIYLDTLNPTQSSELPSYLTPYHSFIVPQVVIITALPKLEKRDKWIYLTISDRTNSYQLAWALPPAYPSSVALESNCVYTFTIITNMEQPLGNFFHPNLARVERDGKVIYDREVCEVHQRKMNLKEVPVIYGLVERTGKQPTYAQYWTLFPHYSAGIFWGCSLPPKNTEFLFECPDCKAAREKWEKEK